MEVSKWEGIDDWRGKPHITLSIRFYPHEVESILSFLCKEVEELRRGLKPPSERDIIYDYVVLQVNLILERERDRIIASLSLTLYSDGDTNVYDVTWARYSCPNHIYFTAYSLMAYRALLTYTKGRTIVLHRLSATSSWRNHLLRDMGLDTCEYLRKMINFMVGVRYKPLCENYSHP